jgi:hypothetical protein
MDEDLASDGPMSEDRKGWILDLFPEVRNIALYCVKRHGGDINDAVSGAQWGLVMATMKYRGDARSHWEDFRSLAIYSMFREAKGSVLRKSGMKKERTNTINYGDDAPIDVEDTDSHNEIDLLISELFLEYLRGCMSPDEWSVVRCIVIDSLSIVDVSGELDLTLPRVIEVYNSAVTKMRSYCDRCRAGNVRS